MKQIRSITGVIMLVLVILAIQPIGSGEAQSIKKLTKADIERMMTELSNWGRWGKQDQLGAMNLITPEKRREAARLVREGVSISLAHDTNSDPAQDNDNPFEHKMVSSGETEGNMWAVEKMGVLFHGYQHTHLDALCHMFWNGKMYNGYAQSEVTRQGAGRLAITNLKEGVLARGVLLDIPRLKGVPWLEPGTAIYPEDLDAWLKKAGIKLRPGDVVLVRTGRWGKRAKQGPWNIGDSAAGLHASCAGWLKSHDVSILGSDAASDVLPSGIEGVTHPIHQLVLVSMGINILDNCDLEVLSAEAARRNRWEFMLTTAPLPMVGGTGSPINPIATF